MSDLGAALARITWPDYSARSEPKTVNAHGQQFEGLEILCIETGQALGLIWTEPGKLGFFWRAAHGRGYGTRESKATAVEVLRQIWDIAHGKKLKVEKGRTKSKGLKARADALVGAPAPPAPPREPSQRLLDISETPPRSTPPQTLWTKPPAAPPTKPKMPSIDWGTKPAEPGLTDRLDELLKQQGTKK